MSSVDRLLEDLPTSDESRRKVTRWLEDTAMNHSPQDHSSKMSEIADHPESLQSEGEIHQRATDDGPNVVSILQKSAGSGEAPSKGPSNATPDGRNPRIGPTAALSGPKPGGTPASCSEGSPSQSAPSTKASKRHSATSLASQPKRRKRNSGESEPSSSELDSEDEGNMTPFDPASLVKSR